MEEKVLACPSNESVRLINKSGIPLSYDSIEKLWSRVRRKHPDGQAVEFRIRDCTNLSYVSNFLKSLIMLHI